MLRERFRMKMNRGLAFFLGISAFLAGCCHAGDTLPGPGYPASHYETLWAKSPFAVATPEIADQPSEFSLVGIANLDGVDYASLVNKETNERYFLASGKPQNGLSLVSVTHGEDRDKTYAVIQNNGQTLTLKLSDTAATAAGAPMPQVVNGGMPGQPVPPGQVTFAPQGPNPAMYPQTTGGFPSTMSPQAYNAGGAPRPWQPPMPMIRRPIIHVPAPPPQQQ
jgi:hypothetical protein